jgi:hypothetical protein
VAAIIAVTDLPAAVQSADMVADMVAGANARASRVAPCLIDPTSATWAATTAYAIGDRVKIAAGEFLEATTAGTSGATAPTTPAALDGTVADGSVTWKRIAPTTDQLAEAKLVLLGAVKRWAEAGSGALSSQTAGPFGQTVDTRQRTGFNLWPSEITSLQDVCATGGKAKAFSIDTAPSLSGMHADWCSLNLGATYCSCGADIAGVPIYEVG